MSEAIYFNPQCYILQGNEAQENDKKEEPSPLPNVSAAISEALDLDIDVEETISKFQEYVDLGLIMFSLDMVSSQLLAINCLYCSSSMGSKYETGYILGVLSYGLSAGSSKLGLLYLKNEKPQQKEVATVGVAIGALLSFAQLIALEIATLQDDKLGDKKSFQAAQTLRFFICNIVISVNIYFELKDKDETYQRKNNVNCISFSIISFTLFVVGLRDLSNAEDDQKSVFLFISIAFAFCIILQGIVYAFTIMTQKGLLKTVTLVMSITCLIVACFGIAKMDDNLGSDQKKEYQSLLAVILSICLASGFKVLYPKK